MKKAILSALIVGVISGDIQVDRVLDNSVILASQGITLLMQESVSHHVQLPTPVRTMFLSLSTEDDPKNLESGMAFANFYQFTGDSEEAWNPEEFYSDL
jgi:hypothetical protein